MTGGFVNYLLHNLYIIFFVPLSSICKIPPVRKEQTMNIPSSSTVKPVSRSRRSVCGQVRLRGLVSISMISLLLEFIPGGQRSGQLITFFLTKTQWGDIHFWMSIAAGALTIIHLMVDWKALKACAHYLISAERGNGPCE